MAQYITLTVLNTKKSRTAIINEYTELYKKIALHISGSLFAPLDQLPNDVELVHTVRNAEIIESSTLDYSSYDVTQIAGAIVKKVENSYFADAIDDMDLNEKAGINVTIDRPSTMVNSFQQMLILLGNAPQATFKLIDECTDDEYIYYTFKCDTKFREDIKFFFARHLANVWQRREVDSNILKYTKYTQFKHTIIPSKFDENFNDIGKYFKYDEKKKDHFMSLWYASKLDNHIDMIVNQHYNTSFFRRVLELPGVYKMEYAKRTVT